MPSFSSKSFWKCLESVDRFSSLKLRLCLSCSDWCSGRPQRATLISHAELGTKFVREFHASRRRSIPYSLALQNSRPRFSFFCQKYFPVLCLHNLVKSKSSMQSDYLFGKEKLMHSIMTGMQNCSQLHTFGVPSGSSNSDELLDSEFIRSSSTHGLVTYFCSFQREGTKKFQLLNRVNKSHSSI